MKKRTAQSIAIFCMLGFAPAAFCMDAVPTRCAGTKQVLWYCPGEKLDAKTYNGFSRDLFGDLSLQLTEIGYCLRYYSAGDSLASSPKGQNNLCLQIHTNDSSVNHASDNGEKNLVAELCRMSELTKAKTGHPLNRQLLSLIFSSDDSTALRSVFVKKIVENLRTQYICDVVITSDPLGVQIMTPQGGLADVTPLEWVVPVGSLHVQCSMKKYVTLDKELLMPKPGAYTYFLQMKKKQFYNSKYFYPAVFMLASSVVLYYGDTYYYNRYNRLGELEMRNDPNSFGSTFQKAKNFESASIAALVLCGCFMGLTFWF
jgi:hypothetical protein